MRRDLFLWRRGVRTGTVSMRRATHLNEFPEASHPTCRKREEHFGFATTENEPRLAARFQPLACNAKQSSLIWS
jgi:hypothetical protein